MAVLSPASTAGRPFLSPAVIDIDFSLLPHQQHRFRRIVAHQKCTPRAVAL
jgi:hypothetical protein